jgi:hypothetical protein
MAILNILRTFGVFYGRLEHSVLIWYIFPVLVSCTKKNLAALNWTHVEKTVLWSQFLVHVFPAEILFAQNFQADISGKLVGKSIFRVKNVRKIDSTWS